MNCFRRNVFLSFAIAVVLASACTRVDDTLGSELIPDNQKLDAYEIALGIDKDEPGYFRSYLVQKDSFPSSDQGVVTFGSRFDPTFGYNTASAIIQPVPTLSPSDEKYYGFNPVVDSVFLQFYITNYGGKTDVEQTFSVYRVIKDIARSKKVPSTSSDGKTYYSDTLYYASYPAAEMCDMSQKLFTFKHSGKSHINAKLEILPAGQTYINELVAADRSIANDSLFLLKFKGLYIVPDQKENDAAQYRASLNVEGGSALTLFAHNYKEDSVTVVKENIQVSYMFTDRSSNATNLTYKSTSITSVERNYAVGTISALINSGTEVGTAYVEGMNGVYTDWQVDPALLTRLQSLCPAGRKMAINNATIFFGIQPGYTPAILNNSFSRLGMFYNYPKFEYVPDYNFAYESSGEYIPYDGTLNRTKGNFEMNITQTIQKMVSSGKCPEKISLTPEVASTFDFTNTPLRGSAGGGYKVKLKITYTLVVP